MIMMMRMLLMLLMMMTMVIHRNPGCTVKLGLVALPVQTLIKVFNLFQTFTRYIADGREGSHIYKLLSTKYSLSLQLRASLLQWEPKIGWTGLLVGHVLSFTTGGQLCLVWTQNHCVYLIIFFRGNTITVNVVDRYNCSEYT